MINVANTMPFLQPQAPLELQAHFSPNPLPSFPSSASFQTWCGISPDSPTSVMTCTHSDATRGFPHGLSSNDSHKAQGVALSGKPTDVPLDGFIDDSLESCCTFRDTDRRRNRSIHDPGNSCLRITFSRVPTGFPAGAPTRMKNIPTSAAG